MKKPKKEHVFLDQLRKTPVVLVAAEKCGLSRQSIYRWRSMDPKFASNMDAALAEGEGHVNDVCESQLLSLIKDRSFAAIRYWLSHRHPKYKPMEKVPPPTDEQIETEEILKALGLTDLDFTDDKIDETSKRITEYLQNR